MEAFLAFDPHNYPFLLEYNSRFLDVISRIAFKNKMVTADSKEAARRILSSPDNEELSNILVLIFVPYVASLRILRENTTTSNLLCDTVINTCINFEEYMDHITLHVTDSSSSTSRAGKQGNRTVTSERSLYYFVELTKFAFGSNPMAARNDAEQGSLVLSLHRHWLSSHSSPIYLLEATERLLVSASLKATLTLILQAVLSKCREFLKFYGELPSQALLYINGKFTCEFSHHCSNRLSKKDLILLQLLVESKCMPKSCRSKANSSNVSPGDSRDGDVSYFGDTEGEVESSDASRCRRSSRSGVGPVLQSFAEDIHAEPVLNAAPFLLFMEGSKDTEGLRLPFCLRTIEVTPDVIIIVTSELTTRFHAKSMHSVISTLTKVLFARQEFKSFDELHEFDKSCLYLKKILDRGTTKASQQLRDRITQLIQADIRKYCSGLAMNDLPIRVDALASSVCSSIRDYYHEYVYLFEMRRMRKVSELEQVRWHMMSMQSFAQDQSRHYIEYLEVKSKINMTIEPYIQILPGLKAFLYVDRKINTLVYAAADQKAKEAISLAVAQCYGRLMSGNLSSSFPVNDLTGHYVHWFESLKGNTMKPAVSSLALQSFPCLIRSNFLYEIQDKCFPCKRRDSFCCWGKESISSYEILVLCKDPSHPSRSRAGSVSPASFSLSSTPFSDIEVRCKRLASKLSEFVSPEHFVSTLF